MSADGVTAPLPDGTYDVFVVDVDGPRADVTVTAGEHKGEVLTIVGATEFGIDTMGMPGTMTVADGRPTLALDD